MLSRCYWVKTCSSFLKSWELCPPLTLNFLFLPTHTLPRAPPGPSSTNFSTKKFTVFTDYHRTLKQNQLLWTNQGTQVTQTYPKRRKVFTPRFISVTAQTRHFAGCHSGRAPQRRRAIMLSEQIYPSLTLANNLVPWHFHYILFGESIFFIVSIFWDDFTVNLECIWISLLCQ